MTTPEHRVILALDPNAREHEGRLYRFDPFNEFDHIHGPNPCAVCDFPVAQRYVRGDQDELMCKGRHLCGTGILKNYDGTGSTGSDEA